MLLLGGLPADAACTPPSAPDQAERPTKPTPPIKGPCVDAKPGTQGCLGWEAYKFNEDVKAYNEQAKAFQAAATGYVAKLNAYVKAAGDYVGCEVQPLR